MRFPTIHLNGTSREELLRQHVEAAEAIDTAILKLREAAPNGRDYYPQHPAAINEALEDLKQRLNKLYEVQSELRLLIAHIVDAF